MKKRISILVFIFLIFFILILSHVKAQEQPVDARQVLAKEFNVSLDKVPQNQSDLQRFILAKEWENRIANGSWTGWIHLGFSSTTGQYVFLIIFAHKYEISLTFLMIFILWILVWFILSQAVEGTFNFEERGWAAVIVGALATIGVANLHVFEYISKALLDSIFAQETWWGQVIAAFIGLGIAAIITFFVVRYRWYRMKKFKAKKEADAKQAVNEIKSLAKGIKEVK